MEVIGQIKLIGETQTFGNDFTKRQLVVTTNEQYPQFISIDFIKDKCNILDKYKVGDNVKVSINLGGREWISPKGEIKYFNSITGWRIDKVDSNIPEPNNIDVREPVTLNKESDDDLPF